MRFSFAVLFMGCHAIRERRGKSVNKYEVEEEFTAKLVHQANETSSYLFPNCYAELNLKVYPPIKGAIWAMCGCIRVARWGVGNEQDRENCNYAANHQNNLRWGKCQKVVEPAFRMVQDYRAQNLWLMCDNTKVMRRGIDGSARRRVKETNIGNGNWWLHNTADGARYLPVRRTFAGINRVVGFWEDMSYHLTGPSNKLRLKYTRGSTKTNAWEKTSEWASEVSVSVTASMKVTTGFMGSGVEVGLETSLSSSLSKKMGRSYSGSWSSNAEYSEEREFVGADGLQVWQWWVRVIQDWGPDVFAKTTSFAQTDGLYKPPRCVPGYVIPRTKWQECHPDGQLPF